MNTLKMMSWTISVTIIVLLLNGYGVTHAQPKSGDWTVTTDFGQLVLTVNSDGTYITKIGYTFSSWTIGSVTRSGTVTISTSPGWSITDNKFTINNNLDPWGDQKMTINGEFNQTGDGASGTWSANFYGTTASGTWEAIYSAVEDLLTKKPVQFELAQNTPNPFNSSTTIRFRLPKSSFIILKIYDFLGKEIETLLNGQRQAGLYKVNWNAKGLPSGIYLYSIQAGEFAETKKLILQR